MIKMLTILLVGLVAAGGAVQASGLAIPEQGAAAMAMSAAMTARSENLSAIFYNPAGIDYVENNEVFVGLTPIMPSHTYTHTGGTSLDAESQTFLPPQLYAARRFSDRIVAGVGVYAPFGLGTDWGKTWNGRYTSTFAEIQAIYVNPTLSYKLNDTVTLGIGVSYVNSSAIIEKMVDTGLKLYGSTGNPAFISAYDSEFKLDGSGSGFGFNLGALLRPMEKLQLGISYRGATDIEYEGDAKFTHDQDIKAIPVAGTALYNGVAAAMPAKQGGKATLHLPWMLNLGGMYTFTERWDASVDVDFVGWSVYDKLTIDFADDLPYPEQTAAKDWKNSYVLRFGTSYDLTPMLSVMGGFLYDTTPVPDETFDGQLPDNNRTGISVGAGLTLAGVDFAASYMFLSFADRTKDNLVGYPDMNGDGTVTDTEKNTILTLKPDYSVGSGDYESSANLFSVSASYKF